MIFSIYELNKFNTNVKKGVVMLVVRKTMTKEIVEYVAGGADSTEIVKYNMHLDKTHKANKFIDLNTTKVDGRYFSNAKRFFEYLSDKKGYEKEDVSYGEE
jgi:hypothetical protein